jgi:hypothetical protein
MTVVKSVSAGLRDSESETQLNLNRPLRISPGPRHLSRPASDNRPVPGPCSEKSASPREGSERGEALNLHMRFAVGNTWARWDSIPVVFFPGMASHPRLILLTYVRRPFPPRRNGEYRKGMISARPLYQRESGSVIAADRTRSIPSCVLPQGVPQVQTESWGIVLAVICWSPSA